MLGLWYAVCTGAIALSPWLIVLLTDAGFSESEASLLLAFIPAGRLLGAPLWSMAADRTSPERVLRTAIGLSVVGSGLMLMAEDRWLLFGAIVLWALARAPAGPIVDATTVAMVGLRYGRVRAWGSLAYLVVAGLSGAMRALWAPLPIVVSAVLSVLTFGVTLKLPPLVRATRSPQIGELAALLRHPVLLPMSVVSVLHGATIGSYDHLFALHVEQLHLGSWVTGASLAVGVSVEIGMMAGSEWILPAVGARRLMWIAVASGVPRFLLTSVVRDPLGLIAIQALHGIHFGVAWLAATALFAEHAPPSLKHTTQSLLPATMFGAGPLLGLLLGATVLARAEMSELYVAMAALSAVAAGITWWSSRSQR